ncbi:MAG: 3-isopropylmalate dehydratase small subunit [Cellvibrionales bacterium]|mgnify:FL=1|nr:3-isopropylmalate dehydratase small subunit [Cellvibrionales bacterium]HCH20783.1 3-isopropylmalate dehydratase small subunit [Cellvibrionales bacterium]
MRAFTALEGVVMPIDRANVDTDMIIPKQFLKSIKRSGFGPYLFDELRYLDKGEPDMDCTHRPLNTEFSLNHERYAGANILLSRQNFGCGSSREHAPWALDDFGFRCLIAPSFADIFFNNCFKNGILPIQLSDEIVDQLFDVVDETEGFSLAVDLASQTITLPDGSSIAFEVDSFRKHCLLNGLDDIALTLEDADQIRAFEVGHKQKAPWLYR